MSVERYFSVETGITFNSIAIEKLFDRIARIGSRSRTAVSKSMPVKPIAASPQKLMHSLSGAASFAPLAMPGDLARDRSGAVARLALEPVLHFLEQRVERQAGIADRRQFDRHVLVD